MTDLSDMMLPYIRSLDTYQAVDSTEVMAERAGIPSDQIIRLNGNENPYGPSPKVAEALGSVKNYNLYPDPQQRKLRDALSAYLDVSADQIVTGNGSDEIIDLLLRMFVGPGENIITPAPTFGMYAFSTGICGGEAISVQRDENYEIDIEAMRLAITPKTKGFFFASPNNPTGNIATEGQVRSLLETGLLVVVDETYYEFCGHTMVPLLDDHPNLVVLRSFSKWAGLAGLRIGLGAMHPDLAGTMMSVKPPYNVNLAAETALLASLEDRATLLERVRNIAAERDRMMTLLKDIPGLTPWPSQANFILCQLPEGRGEEIFEGLCSRGIFLRYFSTARLKDHVRASVGLPHQTDALVSALRELVTG